MLIAKPELLEDPSVPEGVKMYFRDYSKESVLLGMKVLVVSQRLHWNHEDHHAYYKKNQGVGPSHTLNHAEYDKHTPLKQDKRDGVPPNTFHNVGISSWMYEHQRSGGKLVATLHDIGERYDGSYLDD